MKKIILLIVLLAVLLGGGFGLYTYVLKDSEMMGDVMDEMALTAEEKPQEKLYLAEIRSFQVPVLHNSIAVKFLVFHILLNVEDKASLNAVSARMNNLVDIYIRYLVAHYEVNSVGDVLNRTELVRMLHQATEEVMGDRIRLKNVIVQGVYQKNAGA